MELTNDLQYIHFHKSGLVYYFYKEHNNIFVKTIKDNKTFTKDKICENIVDYSIDMDDSGLLHLVSISSSGDLKYFIYKDNKWHSSTLTKYDGKSYRFKNLKLFIIQGEIHILMAISNIINSSLWTLKHYYWNHKNWFTKRVCDMVTQKYDIAFHADIDQANNIHIVFKSLYNQKYQIFYCKYNTKYNLWNIPLRISNASEDNSHPFIFCDKLNGGHIAWSSYCNNNLAIFYSYNENINSPKKFWSEMQQLSNEGSSCTLPFIFQVDNEIKILWKENTKYCRKNIDLKENIWSEQIEIKLDEKIKLFPISILGNNYKSLTRVKITVGYGIYLQDFNLIGLDHIELKDPVKKFDGIKLNPSSDPQENNFYNAYEDISITHDSTQIQENISSDDKNNFQEDPMDKLIVFLQDIQQNQQKIIQLLENLEKQQNINDEKSQELLDLYFQLNENLHSEKNRRLLSLKNLLK